VDALSKVITLWCGWWWW